MVVIFSNPFVQLTEKIGDPHRTLIVVYAK